MGKVSARDYLPFSPNVIISGPADQPNSPQPASQLPFLRQEDEEKFEDQEVTYEKPSEPQPDYQFRIRIGGTLAKMAQLPAMEDLSRHSDRIQTSHFVAAEDGVLNQFCKEFKLPWDLRLYQPLYDSLILPTGLKGFGTTEDLFRDISSLLHKYVMLPRKECRLLAYWAISTWFTFLVSAIRFRYLRDLDKVSGNTLLRLTVVVCRMRGCRSVTAHFGSTRFCYRKARSSLAYYLLSATSSD